MSISDYADLEIGLHRRDSISYTVELRFSHTLSDDDKKMVQSEYLPLAQFDTQKLTELSLDPRAYGKDLTDKLFADAKIKTAFLRAYTIAADRKMPLRLRLFIGASVPELHRLRWETLCFPQSEEGDKQEHVSLLTSERIRFSRYLSSSDWGSLQPRRKTKLRALVVISNPSNLSDYAPDGNPLPPIDVDGEEERIRTSLGSDVEIEMLASNGFACFPTIMHHLRDGYDILYLVAHGAILRESNYHLWLEHEDSTAAVTPGSEFIQRIKELQHLPRLVVLASCNSAGDGDVASNNGTDTLDTLGPRLTEAGIPAVLAMQGNITMQTVEEFMPTFFAELQRDGLIDRAMAVARGHVRDRHDWWRPVLFMRLKSGRLWYEPNFSTSGRGRGDEKWDPLINSIRDKECTPIIGSGLTDSFFGPRRWLAKQLAEDYDFPMIDYHREELSHVAQYLSVHKSKGFPYRTLVQYFCKEIQQRHSNILPASSCDVALDKLSRDELLALLNELMIAVWKEKAKDPAEPYSLLARLPLPIYITTDPTDLLTTALQAENCDPQVVLSPWNDHTRKIRSIYKKEPDYRPTPERPLVYHLFGRLQEPDSLVLTEDDYFNYLMGITRNKNRIPTQIRSCLTDSALLFLGFQMNDWNFRVFFQSLLSQEGGALRDNHAHVAVQIAPEEDRILDPRRASQYFEDYFFKESISIYWGSIDDFAQELYKRWK